MLAMLLLASLVPSLGCVGARGACGACQNCSHGSGCVRNGFFARHLGGGGIANGLRDRYADPSAEGAGAPPTGQVAYPYYTNRGPRDFLQNNPPSIGY
jgi:hypothetical protein